MTIQRSDAYFHGFVEASGAPLNVWMVDCTGTGGEEAAFAWNADTGGLLRISLTCKHAAAGPGTLRSDDAIRFGRAYLHEFRFGRRNAGWHLAEAPDRNGLAWVVRFRAGGWKALVHVDAADGSVQYATLL
jgi:hypothetical protein